MQGSRPNVRLACTQCLTHTFFHGCKKSCEGRPGYEARNNLPGELRDLGYSGEMAEGLHAGAASKYILLYPALGSVKLLRVGCRTPRRTSRYRLMGYFLLKIDYLSIYLSRSG